MKNEHIIREGTMVDLISGITERIASGYDPEQLLQLNEEQILAAWHCLEYINNWSDALLYFLIDNGTLDSTLAISNIVCTKMCDKEGASMPNKAILTQVQRLRNLPQDVIFGSEER